MSITSSRAIGPMENRLQQVTIICPIVNACLDVHFWMARYSRTMASNLDFGRRRYLLAMGEVDCVDRVRISAVRFGVLLKFVVFTLSLNLPKRLLLAAGMNPESSATGMTCPRCALTAALCRR